MKKIFIVGYPRSGTTLLQTLIMCDANVYSCPETQFFNLAPLKNRFYKKFLPKGVRAYIYLRRWAEINSISLKLGATFNYQQLTVKLFQQLEAKAFDAGKSIFVEKTPGHARHVDEIRRAFPDAQFIHLVRSPSDSVASMCKAAKGWGGDTDFWSNLRRWYDYLYFSSKDIGLYDSPVVFYEDIVNDLPSTVEYLNSALTLSIPTDITMEDITRNSAKVVSKNEHWKHNNLMGQRKLSSDSSLTPSGLNKVSESAIEILERFKD